MISKLRILLFLIIVSAVQPLHATPVDTTISFVNIYPGADIYELEGHSVLRIVMPGTDIAVSYGTYDFQQPNFVYRFVKGETDYWVTAIPWQYVYDSYSKEGRRIVSHRLNLTSDQKTRLIELLSENLKPQNRTYRYNYVKDNCATRPLQIVEKALGDTLVMPDATASLAGEQSFRSIMRHYHKNYPWYQFGIDLALGSGIDYPLTTREKSFAPALLDQQLPNASVNGQPIVSSSDIINDCPPDAAIESPTPWYATPLCVTLIILAATIVVTIRDQRKKTVSKWFDAMLFGVFGLAGCLISFLVFISVHEATSPNILLLWLNPFCFIPTIFIWINRCKLIILSYQIVNFVALMILLALSAADVQVLNIAFFPLIIADAIRASSYIHLNIKTLKCRK